MTEIEGDDSIPDAETISLAQLNQLFGGVPRTPQLQISEKDRQKRTKIKIRSLVALTLILLYAVITLYVLVALVNHWVEFEEIRDFVALVYGGLIGLVGTAIALVGRKGG